MKGDKMKTITEKLGIEDIDVYASIFFLVSLVVDLDLKDGEDDDLLPAIRNFIQTRIGRRVFIKVQELLHDEINPFLMKELGLFSNESADA